MGGAGRGSGAAAAAPIPAGSKKLVAELKLIVDFPENEIYAMLRECNMDPNEAVHRLLSQDTFHEVKSKRDKKKEIKEPEAWTRVGSSSGRGTRAATERVGRGVSIQSNDHGAGRGKPLKKKEHGTGVVPTTSMTESSTVFNNTPWKSQVPNIHASAETKMHPSYDADELSPSLQPSSGIQNNWLVKPGHVSMADIVKMGRPQPKPSSLPVMASERSFTTQNVAAIPQHGAKRPPDTVQAPDIDKNSYSRESISHVPEISHELGIDEGQHDSYDGWTLIDEQSSRSGPTMIDKYEVPVENADPVHFTSSNLVADDNSSSHVNPHFQEIQSPDDDFDDNSLLVESRSASASDRHIQVDISGDASLSNDGLIGTANSYHSPQQRFEHHEESFAVEDAGVASAATELHNLSLHGDDANRKSSETNPAVIIPDHLQVTNADCAHLSFGSFESGTFAGSFPSKSLQSNVEVVATVVDSSSPIEQPDSRTEYYDPDQQLTASLTGTVTSETDNGNEHLEMTSASEPELTRNDPLDTRYNVPSVSDYSSSSTHQPNIGAYTYPQGNVQMQNLSPFSSLMQPSALQSNLLASSLPPLRDFDLSFSPFITAQTVPTKYNAAGSSISGSTVPLQEAVKPGGFTNPQPQQNLPSTSNSSTASALPQHLPMHHYSQPALPLSHYTNMISYPFLPQSYTYLPSAAFQQAYAASNGPFHQSPASLPNAGMKYMLPQYKSNASVTSLPQSATVASVYGGFGNSTITPGNFSLNPAAASPTATLGFDETLNLQYKEGNQFMPLQQTESPAMWGHDAGSRTISAHPGSNFYNYPAQNQQTVLRQSQQSSQFGNLGYPNFYHSQAGASQEHQQTPSEGNLNGSQNGQAQPAHHIWQHSY